MSFAHFGWRAGTGYIPPPNAVPAPIVASPYSPYFQVPGTAPPGRTVYTSPPMPTGYAHQVFYPNFGVVATASPATAPTLPPACPPTTVATSSAKKTASTSKHPLGHEPPPSLAPGVNYMFPPAHTMLHVFNKGAPIWEDRYQGQGLAFKIFKVSTAFCVGEVIERVMGAKGEGKERCKGWACTEVVECGDGRWIKGTTIPYGSDKASGTLGSMGWNEKRGPSLPPVWLVVHKA